MILILKLSISQYLVVPSIPLDLVRALLDLQVPNLPTHCPIYLPMTVHELQLDVFHLR